MMRGYWKKQYPQEFGSPQNQATLQSAGFPSRHRLRLWRSSFWQGVLFGNPDSLVSGSAATSALRLVADRLGIPIAQNETILTLRAGQLRKLQREKFGPSKAEQTMATLWQAAPASPDAPRPK
jgi:hypothetical protein